jgi:zinc finger CCCH domain-containing protein 13
MERKRGAHTDRQRNREMMEKHRDIRTERRIFIETERLIEERLGLKER